MANRKNKKAVSLMLSYVLLIVIALSLAVGVYVWLTKYANIEETPKCPVSASLIIQNYSCDNVKKEIRITVENKGLFNIEGYDIRGTDKTGEDAIFPLANASAADTIENGRYIFGFSGGDSLKPNEINSHKFSYAVAGITGDLKKVEIEVFEIEGGHIILCEQAKISQEVNC